MDASSDPLTVIVAEPVALLRWGVAYALGRDPGIAVLEASDADGVRRAAAAGRPDLVIAGIGLPPDGALAALPVLAAELPARVLVLGSADDPAEVAAALRAGAHGFLSRDLAPDGLIRAVRAAARGEQPLPRSVVTAVIAHLLRIAEGVPDPAAARARLAVLSPREREVVRLVAAGASSRGIAERLGISPFTVKRHVHNILAKLAVRTRAEAAALAAAADPGPAEAVREGHAA